MNPRVLRLISATMLVLLGTVMVPSASLAAGNGANFDSLVDQYITAYRNNDRIHKAIYLARIRKQVFADPHAPEYRDRLIYLDSRSSSSPEAIYDVARSLQLHWEAEYALGLGQRKIDRANGATKVGAIIGMTALGASLLVKPQAAPRYFRIFRHLFPFVGTGAGMAAGQTMNAIGILDQALPPSPAHLMHIGISTDEYAYDDQSLSKDLLSLTGSIAVGSAAYELLRIVKTVRTLNLATTPAKLNPYILVTSLALSIAFEKAADAAIDHQVLTKFQQKVTTHVRGIDNALVRGDDALAFSQADALVKTSANLSTYLNQPLLQAVKRFSDHLERLSRSGMAENSSAFQYELRRLTKDLQFDLQQIRKGRTLRSDYEGYLIRGYLAHHDSESLSELRPAAKARADMVSRAFQVRLAQYEECNQTSLGERERTVFFREFLEGLDEHKDRQLSQELRAGDFSTDPLQILLQAAAFLRNAGKEYLQDNADYLMAMIARNDLLLSTLGLNAPNQEPAP